MDDLFPRFREQYPVNVYLQGYGAETHDSVQYAERMLPLILSIALGVVVVVIGIVSQSIVAPIRCCVGVGLTIVSSFGLVNIVFARKALNNLNVGGLSGDGSVAWVVPLSAFVILVGISLHYELLSTFRVLEYHRKGVVRAVLIGVADTAREISVAALIMIVIFGSFIFSELPAMNELGMYLFFGALLQGFVLRLFFAAPVMAALGRYHYWPNEEEKDRDSSISMVLHSPVAYF